MRRSRRSRKKLNNKNKVITVLAFFVFAPTVAVILGLALVKYFIYPIFTNEELSINKDRGQQVQETNANSTNTIENKEDSNTETADSEELQLEKTLVINGVNIFNVQVGSFSDIKNAGNLIKDMEEKGLCGYIIKADTNYKVFAGSFYNREEADEYIKEIKKYYKDSFINSAIIGQKSIKYKPEDSEYIDQVSDLLATVTNAYGQECSLWPNALLEDDKELLKQSMVNNTESIEQKIELVEEKVVSEQLSEIINNLKGTIQVRKEICSKLENKDSNLIKEYKKFNQSLFNYGVSN
ncbi:SPOR domain-containing protein [Caldisalinibacter kiritimatiensis]|uniref:SPOR domain-containing protein n=1 Tax=Caldisalinibacter kiritimatiensis TaxID=1304284 RepID=R1CMB4_9FIRM|nr:SPOR domain-containing protein [Caldisalinibacter kiritimatiensis]EOC99845.1 hypothetical protein L21TH_2150 [Caldisalinibacter kiritimatiensis]